MILRYRYLSFFIIGFLTFAFLQMVLFLILSQEIFVYTNKKMMPLFLFLALLVFIIFSLLEIKKEANYPLLISLAMILGGGSSNFFDFLRLGGVADYLDFYVLRMNFADIFIFIGVIIFFSLKLANMKKI